MSTHAERPLAIITGATKRVGLATATELARRGCDVLITHRGSAGPAEFAREHIQAMAPAANVKVRTLELDNPAHVEAFARELASQLPRIDVLVHNASVYEPTPLESLTVEQCEQAYRVNAIAPLVLTRALAPKLSASTMRGGGSIVTLCDIHATGESSLPRKGFFAYAMSKSALAQLTMDLARELAPRVRVNAVAPGVVAFPDEGPESDPAMQERYLKRVPLARSGTVEEAAKAVTFLAFDATYCTGQVLRVDGGRAIG
jgi:pteridine reductase